MSTATQLTGLASGLDWRSLVDKLMAAERAPETRMRAQQTRFQQQTNALDNFKTRLSDLQTSIKALGATDDAFGARSATIATTSGWSASAAANADAGTYKINVTQLATRTQRVGALDAGGRLSATSDVSGLTIGTLPIAGVISEGEFTVNGARITVAKTDSLQDVLTQISTKTGGAVTASYDPSSDKVQLNSGSEIVLGSANDTSNFLTALQLFNNGTGSVLPPKALGVVSVSSAIANANLKNPITAVDGSGNGTFQINGVDITYNVNTDSVQAIMAKITASSAGVTAAYDKSNDRFSLTNKTTGDVGLNVSEAAGGLLEALGLNSTATLAKGKNALFTVDGGATRTSTSNTLDDAATGLSGVSVTATSETEQTVTVAADNKDLRARIEDFISKFNAVQSFIDTATKTSTSGKGEVSTSILSGNLELAGISSGLRGFAFKTVPGLSGAIQRLDSLGIDFKSGTAQLEIKSSSALDTALANHADDVKKLFSDSTNGLSSKLDAYLTQTIGADGPIASQTKRLAKQSTDVDEQIRVLERRLASEQARLEQTFIQMEQTQSALQSQLAALTNAFGGSNK